MTDPEDIEGVDFDTWLALVQKAMPDTPVEDWYQVWNEISALIHDGALMLDENSRSKRQLN